MEVGVGGDEFDVVNVCFNYVIDGVVIIVVDVDYFDVGGY